MAFVDLKIEAPPYLHSPPFALFSFLHSTYHNRVLFIVFSLTWCLSPTLRPTPNKTVSLEQAFYAEYPAPTTESGTQQLLSQDLSNVIDCTEGLQEDNATQLSTSGNKAMYINY